MRVARPVKHARLEQQGWVDKLIESGFDTSKNTFFLWEGVTQYLPEKAVKQALRAIISSSGKGIVITFDFSSKELVKGRLVKTASKVIESNFVFAIDHEDNPRETIEILLKEADLTLGELIILSIKPSNYRE